MISEENNSQQTIDKEDLNIKNRLENLVLLINKKNEEISSLKAELKEREENEKNKLNKIFTTIDTIDEIRIMAKKTKNKELLSFVENEMRKLRDSLRKIEVEEIPTIGEIFNSKIHVCVATKNTRKVQKDQIIEELKRGYYQNGKVLRYAEVIIEK